ncbi:alpha/beta fold hydrolase [Streptomyces sp. VRA16 Mangrove soil]|uniref:alpha/beta fold hydrolase n=1 Tax=Streptomyces sp. VRA16 Mangrove soil TaxID=2817434 RepID=UPI001A9E3DAA|nr:alpha/beta hydrolase [Streptomyces sp. VRA16 Mangrove soil]MBO1330420.1 alpha/beta hydrolase [Streptomyces sp. VRA16 Mangrove soil]
MRFHLPKSRRLRGLALAALLALGTATFSAAPAAPASASSAGERLPAGFSEHKTRAAGIGLHYVVGGHGPTLMLLHGYPQTWYEWHDIMPALAEHYTVIAPDLPGAGQSDAPRSGYDKKTMAAELHALLVSLGKDSDVRIVGHDIGTMVAYSYAAQYPATVKKLVLSEAPIPDRGIYKIPSLTEKGPGVWNFGFFNLASGLPEDMIKGREVAWTAGFIGGFEGVPGAVSPADIRVYAHYLRDPAHMRASLAWFRVFPQDISDNEQFRKTPLPMPVLAIGASGSLGESVGEQVEEYASDVTPATVPDSGHWIYEEHPQELTAALLAFLGRS